MSSGVRELTSRRGGRAVALMCLASVSCGHVTEQSGDTAGGGQRASAGGSSSTGVTSAGGSGGVMFAAGEAGQPSAGNKADADLGGGGSAAACPGDAGLCTP